MSYTVTSIKPFGALIKADHPDRDIHDVSVSELRQLFRREHLVALRGFRTFAGASEFANYCEGWGEISVWPFGKVLELVEQENPTDHIFDHSYVPLHWDGMYRPQVPEYQIFHCVQAPLPGQGGRTTFSNTVLALENASPDLRTLWSGVEGTYRRKMDFYDSATVSPIIVTHPHRGFPVIRYNEPPSLQKGRFVNPPDLAFAGVSDLDSERFHRDLRQALYAATNYYAHEWQAGDVVIADNFSLLHGREAFTSRSPRHIRRVHVLSDPPFDNPGLKFHR